MGELAEITRAKAIQGPVPPGFEALASGRPKSLDVLSRNKKCEIRQTGNNKDNGGCSCFYPDRRAIVPCPSISPSYRVPTSSFAVTHASSLRATPARCVRLSISRPASPRRGSCRACLLDSSLDESSGNNPDDESIDSSTGATINLNLPRRSSLVQFTCNECGDRTSRLVNKLAYERGLIYVQCDGCQRYHKLVDNNGV